ncbi:MULTISPECIES: helix-turn-helix domain-containing protein [Intestinimonas]|uniref:helix-turn-helix domain-containing protein n=1 Tax=Intestinimonas TaxID=1392389 RepID=UPI00067EE980|nr:MULTISPECIES: helix-turn-helix domain-containing protein [Intestinimonas]MCI5562385.1 helix-turn-helix domain-containing protein [Intestinimonas massiliensis (ex Afouda et al. 2020)]MDY5338125.1 helix-turn-helix domain-containing protein [Intestinimonas sp.]
MEERPAYWAVIPSFVRYDPDLPPNAKLLYGEVTALSGKRGYCYAQNGYFAELFSLSERSISRLFAVLVERGYLRVDVIRDESTQEVLERRICAVYDQGTPNHPHDNFVGTPPDNFVETPPDKNVGENNTSIEYIPPIVPQGGQLRKPKEPKKLRAPKSIPTWKPERFEAFWKFYPRHEDRVSAVREWDRLKPEDELIDAIARALKWQVRAEDWPAPYACRYLRNQRWLDEPTPKSSKAAPVKTQAQQLTGWHTEVIDGEEVMVPDG